ncbi:MAG: hypothetical protein Crog4KO_31410 [Crocinitomicaceae bacterium]
MNKLLLTFVASIFLSYGFAQTGSLVTNVDFIKDVQCATYNLNLSNSDTTIVYKKIKANDTISDIPSGLYQAHFYACDSSFSYGQKVEIVEGQTRRFTYRNNAYINDDQEMYDDFQYDDDYYYEYYDSLYAPVYFGVHWQFSRGMDFDGTNPDLLNNFAFDYSFGHDFLLTKPVALGYEFGFGFTQANYISEDLANPLIKHQKQRFTTFDINIAAVTSFYIKDHRLLTLGARYRLPYFARYARINGDEKLSTKGLHKYNDLAVFAQLGYNWGYVFAEYRFDQILRAPMGELPNLSIGIRLSTSDNF